VPREVEELAIFLVRLARTRQDPPVSADEYRRVHHRGMPDRLLVTKAEAAERLGVSVRTIERLVATGAGCRRSTWSAWRAFALATSRRT